MGDAGHAAPEIGDDVDDHARRLALDPGSRGGLHHVPGAVEVVVDHRRPALWREVERHLRELAASIVDENVEASALAPYIGEEGRTPRVIAYVEGFGVEPRAETLEEGFGLRQSVLVAPQNGEIGAETGKQRGDGEAEAAAGAGDDHGLALEEIGPVNGRPGAELRIRQAVVPCAFQGHGRVSLAMLAAGVLRPHLIARKESCP